MDLDSEPPAYQALLDLEKGTAGSPFEQLKEAARIIGVDLDYYTTCDWANGNDVTPNVTAFSAPKEEWVLRWLLKKLKTSKKGEPSYNLDERAWILLRLLFDRVPLKTLAFTLNENKLLGILKDSLVQLASSTTTDKAVPGEVTNSDTKSQSKRATEAESPARSRKRKRSEAILDDAPSALSSSLSHSSNIYLAIFECVRRFVAIVDQIPADYTSLKSQLEVVLQGEPQIASTIIGHSFRQSTTVISKLESSASLTLKQRIFSSLLAALEVWRLRSDHLQNDENSSNVAFISHALSEGLELLQGLHRFPGDSPIAGEVVHGIERLVVVHLILHIRQVFFSIPSESITPNSQTSPKQIQLVLDEINSRFGEFSGDTCNNLLPTLLDIAIRAVPRTTFRRQVNEAPWLESLFVALSAKAGYSLGTNATRSSTALLERFLQVAIKRKLAISLETLVQYSCGYSGLLGDSSSQIEWHLLSLLVQLGVDVFLPNSGVGKSKDLLDALIHRVTSLWIQSPSIPSELNALVKNGIIIPLLRGFFDARDGDTFSQIWTEQLRILQSARCGDKNMYLSVWEDDDVAKAYGDSISNAISDSQVNTQVEGIISNIIVEDGKLKDEPEGYAQLIILDAVLMTPKAASSVFQNNLPERIFDMLSALISSGSHKVWRWRLWREAQNLIHQYPSSPEFSPFDLKKSMLPTAVKRVRSFHKKSKTGVSAKECLEAFWCFNFVASVVNKSESNVFGEYFDSLVQTIVPLSKVVPSSTDLAWNGRMETVTSPAVVVIGCLGTLLAKNRATVQLSTETRQMLFSHLLSSIDQIDGAPAVCNLKDQLIQVWDSFVCPDWVMKSMPLVNDLVTVVYDRLKEQKTSYSLLIRSLLDIPTQLIPRYQRGLIIDLLQATILQNKVNVDVKNNVLLLMTRLVETSKSSAQITSDWQVIWTIAHSTTIGDSEIDQSLFQAFAKLHAAVADRFTISSDDNVAKYIQETYGKVCTVRKNVQSPNFETMEYFLFTLSLEFLHSRESLLGDNDKKDTIRSLRQDTFTTVLSDLTSLTRTLKKKPGELERTKLTGVLSVLDTFQDLLHGNKDARKTIRKLEEAMAKSDSSLDLRRSVKRRTITYKKPGTDIESRLIECAPLFPVQQLHEGEQRWLIQGVEQQLSTMTEDQLVKLIQNIRTTGFSGELGSYRLLLIGMVILSFDPVQDRDSPASIEISSTFTDVCKALSNNFSMEAFCFATETLDVILRTQSRSVTQWNIDNALATFSTVVSPSGPRIDRETAGTAYTRLCRLLGTFFGLYRQKLSGRFHLVLPIMQGLLRCLFIHDSKHTGSSRSAGSTLPPWIENNHLQPHHASQFTRLLSSLCDPTVSSVQRRGVPHTSHGLNDKTKKVKSLAGQYLQYLIMEYAGCQLRGHLSPAMKAALMPGMYAVLDVMSPSTMRGMNAALDSSGRAVFKSLYDDYVRFGKWNHD